MPRKNLKTTSWREKRQLQTQSNTNKRRVSKTNRQRFLRQKEATFKKANEIVVDALETGLDRRTYVLIMEKRKSGVHYSTFNSHPDKEWVPTNEEVSNHWPRTNKWGPSNFKESNEEVSNHWPRTDPWDPSDFRESRKGKSCTEKAKGLGIDRPSSYRKIQKAVALIIPRAPLLNL